jgi:ATP-dependent DNA ligase
VPMPAPVALARLVDTMTPPGAKTPIYQPKWDGYRALYSAGRLFSRNGTNLTPLFLDLIPILTARLPADLSLDGELVAWSPSEGRLDFPGLQARMTAGKRIRTVAAQRPAQYVAFDVLAAGREDLRHRPLRERRLILERALSGLGSPIVLCQQTEDLVTARECLRTLTAGGIEGLVIKDAAGSYPTREGQRSWWKYKSKATLDMLAIGFTGTATSPSSLVLAFPGAEDDDGQPVTAGSTTVLSKAAAKPIVPLLRPTGAMFERTFAWGSAEPPR